ncbi:MAG: ABC transporter permease [Chloroflexi bacterium]|nr:ABC transporter permease [Chloroflexota bacterium]HOC21500.1 ABC transporter permease [Anaerolineae bacterium]HQM14444.1 ABC transporter permease [Anaerolineae bacterium]
MTTDTLLKQELRRARTMGIVFLVFAVGILLLFVPGTTAGQRTTFTFQASRGEALALPPLTFATLTGLYVLAILTAFLGAWQIARGFRNRNLVLGIVALLFVLAFLSWAASDKSMNLTGMLQSTLLRAIPIILAALSGVMCEKSGVVNIGIEGMMLSGAFLAALLGSLTGSQWGGLLAALFGGGLMAALLAVLAIKYKVSQVVAGTAINILATGITSYFSSRYLQTNAALNSPPTFKPIAIPLLSKIPIIGPTLFNHTLVVYLTLILVVVIHVMLNYTRWGLRVRAVGEHPRAADTLGINVFKTRYINVILGGMVAGLGGAYLVLSSVARFDELMTAGKGFIGLAAMIFGNWTPFGALGASLIFGFADSLQTKLAILSVPIPSQFLLMAPYLVTMIVLAGVVGQSRAPAADGQPYEKE